MQVGPWNPRVAAQCALLATAMTTPAYNFLRTQEQLGYDVEVSSRVHCDVSGIVLKVSGSAAAAGVAVQKVDEFLEDFGQHLATMSKQEFANVKERASDDHVRISPCVSVHQHSHTVQCCVVHVCSISHSDTST
jgi:secreted Zn-dependent insulinase-like peptidase